MVPPINDAAEKAGTSDLGSAARSKGSARPGVAADRTGSVRPARRRASGPKGAELVRFDLVERILHWSIAGLFAILVVTGAALFFTPLTAVIGRRVLVQEIHLYAGLCLPLPLVLALVGRRGRMLRADLRRLNRWSVDDRLWFGLLGAGRVARRAGRATLAVGKFNAGQKLFAAFAGGALAVMLVTGIMLHWFGHVPLSWRAGATFVHNWLAVALVVVIAGHIAKALSDRWALRSMVRGTVPVDWAKRHAPRWLAEGSGTATDESS